MSTAIANLTRKTAAVLALVAIHASIVQAQTPEAETLFREGKRLLKQGDYAGACEKLDASERLEASIGTELNLANCREKLGQLATAWALFVKAAAAAKHSDTDGKREAEARRRAAALEPKLVHLRVVVADEARVEGLVVKRNDETVDAALWDQRVPVDPGTYEIVAAAPGYERWSTKIKIEAHDKKVEIPALDKSKHDSDGDAHDKPHRTQDEGDTESAKPHRVAKPVGEAAVTADDGGMSGRRKAAIAIGVVGIAALGGGAGFGLYARSLEHDAERLCPQPQCRIPAGVDDNASARSDAKLANIAFAVGGAAVITAGVLWFTGGTHAPDSVAIVPHADGWSVAFGGQF
jgi:hypothetical protein